MGTRVPSPSFPADGGLMRLNNGSPMAYRWLSAFCCKHLCSVTPTKLEMPNPMCAMAKSAKLESFGLAGLVGLLKNPQRKGRIAELAITLPAS
eukprot:1160937-Pelagomonas_calceolata.AAC.11